MRHIHICNTCKKYTMKEECPHCSQKTILARPPKFSLIDKLAKYRIEVKESERAEKGLI